MNNTELFRNEVMVARKRAYLGSIRIARNLRFEVVTLASVVILTLIVIFVLWGQVPRKTRVPGIVVPRQGVVQVSTTVPGAVLESRVVEGARVKTGDVLFILDTDRVGLSGQTAVLVDQRLRERERSLGAERHSRLDNAKHSVASLTNRMRAAEREEEIAQIEVTTALERITSFKSNLEKYEELGQGGFVPPIQVELQRQNLNDAESRHQAARRSLASVQRDIVGLRDDLGAVEIGLQTELAQISRNVAMLQQEAVENEARRRAVIVAPQDSTVTARHVSTGAAVQAGQALATLIPHTALPDELEADLYAASRTAGLVRDGQEVWLRFAAFPFEKFGMGHGVVASVSRTPVNPQDLPQGQAQALLQAAQTTEPLYRVKVRLLQQEMRAFGQLASLKPGMALEADIVQEHRAIWEWLLEPLLAAHGATFGR